jgi:hypothetical protein
VPVSAYKQYLMAYTQDEIAQLAARATLVAYEAILGRRLETPEPLFELTGITAELPHREAAHALVQLPKPVRCFATTRDSCIVLTCKPLTPAESVEWSDWVALGIAADAQQLDLEYGSGEHESAFLLIGATHALRLPASALAYWTRSYDLADVSRFITRASDTLRSDGVSGEIRFDGPLPVQSGLL